MMRSRCVKRNRVTDYGMYRAGDNQQKHTQQQTQRRQYTYVDRLVNRD